MFEHIQIEAVRLLEVGHPTTAAVLQIISLLMPRDADRLARGEELDAGVVSYISDKTGLKPRVVAVVAAQMVRADLSDFTKQYQDCLAFFQKAGSPAKDVEEFLDRLHPDGVFYLLHGLPPAVWEGGKAQLGELFVEQDEDDFDMIVAGHLVAKGMAFGTSVDVLKASIEQHWPNWQRFWAAF